MARIARARLSICALAAGLFGSACDGSRTLQAIYEGPPEQPSGPAKPAAILYTQLDATQIVAGDGTAVTCLIELEGRVSAPARPVTLVATPAVDSVVVDGNRIQFIPPAPGIYNIACRIADGSLVDMRGADLLVEARPPYSWVVNMVQDYCFSATDRLDFDYTILDRDGHEVTDTTVRLEVEPSTGWVGGLTTGLRFLVDGEYKITLGVTSEVDRDSTIAPYIVNIVADATPPEIEFTSPYRDDMIVAGGFDDSWVEVTGTVTDATTAIQRMVINGDETAVSGNVMSEGFSVYTRSRWGLSVAEVHAEDSCGNVAYGTLPFLRGPDFYPAATYETASAEVTGALHVQISQLFADDGDRWDIDDLATLAEIAINSLDLDTLLAPGQVLVSDEVVDNCGGFPGPTYISTGYSVKRHPYSWRAFDLWGPYIDQFQFVDGGLYFDASAYYFELPLEVTVEALECFVGAQASQSVTFDAWVRFDALDTWGVVGADLWAGEAYGAIEDISFEITGLELDIDCGIFDPACDAVTGFIVSAATGIIEWMIERKISELVPPLLEEMLGSIAIDKRIDLPAPLNSALNVAANLETLTFCGASVGFPTPAACHAANWNPGSVSIGVGLQIYPDAAGLAIPTWSRGSLRRPGVVPLFDTQSTSFGAAISDNLINQALWALWYGGGLDIPDVAAALGELIPAGVDASLVAGLPPVLMPGTNGNVLDLGLGDLSMDATVDLGALLGGGAGQMVEIGLSVSVIAGARIDIDPETGALKIAVDPGPRIYFEIYRIDDANYGEFLGERLAQIMTEALPVLLNDALSAVTIPTFDLSAVPGVPQGVVWEMQDPRLTHDNGYLAISGTIGLAD